MDNLNQPQSTPKTVLPNAATVLVLGICSIVFSCAIVGLALGIIGLVLSGKGRKMYRENPSLYDGYGQLNAGFIMSIIGTALGGIYTCYYIIAVMIIGVAAHTPWYYWHS